MKGLFSSFQSMLVSLGLLQSGDHRHDSEYPRDPDQGHAHTHKHGPVDPSIAMSDQGIRAVKWSFLILSITGAFQFLLVFFSGSVALLADMIHNLSDATTAFPLWIAFRLSRTRPTGRFTYGFGRVEDLAGAVIVLLIFLSASIAAYEAVNRFLHPHPVHDLLWIGIAGFAGFVGNELVAVFRIRVGREINSAALIADGYHARTDGFTSLAVVAGAVGVWSGFPLADPAVGLLIAIAILGIVGQSAKAVFTRMLDGVEPGIIDDIRHVAGQVPGIRSLGEVHARWLGHRLAVEMDAEVDGESTVAESDSVASSLEHEIKVHLSEVLFVHIRIRPISGEDCSTVSS